LIRQASDTPEKGAKASDLRRKTAPGAKREVIGIGFEAVGGGLPGKERRKWEKMEPADQGGSKKKSLGVRLVKVRGSQRRRETIKKSRFAGKKIALCSLFALRASIKTGKITGNSDSGKKVRSDSARELPGGESNQYPKVNRGRGGDGSAKMKSTFRERWVLVKGKTPGIQR